MTQQRKEQERKAWSLFWGEAPEGILKYEKGEAVLEYWLEKIEVKKQEILMLIVEEANIARSENEKTSRLTALWNKISGNK